MPLILASILSLAIQVGLIVHVIRTGRSWLWVLAIGFLPLAGSIAYVLVELLPELVRGPVARRTRVGVGRLIDPDRDLRRAREEVAMSGNVDARLRLADALLARGEFAAAAETCAAGLNGVFLHDPALLERLARARFELGDLAAARRAFEDLREHNPGVTAPEARLLYARTLEGLGALDEAEREYAAAARDYPGAEARVRQALLLKRRGNLEAARQILTDVLDAARFGAAHHRRAQAEWLDLARREIQ